MSDKTYTRDEVIDLVSKAADLVSSDIYICGEREVDVINLVVNATGSIMDYGELTLNDVMDENYKGGAATVRQWWDWNDGTPAEVELHDCGCPVQFVKDCGHQEGCNVVTAKIDLAEGPTFSDGPDYSVNHIS